MHAYTFVIVRGNTHLESWFDGSNITVSH